jgi:hypothetical protein
MINSTTTYSSFSLLVKKACELQGKLLFSEENMYIHLFLLHEGNPQDVQEEVQTLASLMEILLSSSSEEIVKMINDEEEDMRRFIDYVLNRRY